MTWLYEQRRSWSDTKLETAKDLLKEHAFHFISFEIADEEADMNRSTDMVIKVTGGDIAVRARRNTGFRDLTIRTRATYGGKTEIHKIREGFAKWYLYMWFDSKEELSDYIIVNLDKVREAKLLDDVQSIINTDGATAFTAIEVDDLKKFDCVVAGTL